MLRRAILSAVIVYLSIDSCCAGVYSGGKGTAKDPYLISTQADLLELAATTDDYGNCFRLINDIIMSGSFPSAIIASSASEGDIGFHGTKFTGSFDGKGYTISNLTINAPESNYLGLFGCIDTGARITGLNLANADINGYFFISGLCGACYGDISVCSITGTVNGAYYVGGICGTLYGGNISNCHADLTIEGLYCTGGVIGRNSNGTATDCISYGYVVSTINGGGICGWNYRGTITRCLSQSSVSGSNKIGGITGENITTLSYCAASGTVCGEHYTGGIAGTNYGFILQCYSTASVSGDEYAGGLYALGEGIVQQCYAAGAVSGASDVGGFTALSYNDNTECFWDVEVAGTGSPGDDSFGAIGKSTADMMDKSTFIDANWDFSVTDGDPADYKIFRPGEDYPRFIWQTYLAADFAGKMGVDIAELEIIANVWLTSSHEYDLDGQPGINLADLAVISKNWLKEYE